MRKQRCRKCEACRSPDCGECSNCLGKVKFGGNGRNHGTCIQRQCTNPQDKAMDTANVLVSSPSSPRPKRVIKVKKRGEDKEEESSSPVKQKSKPKAKSKSNLKAPPPSSSSSKKGASLKKKSQVTETTSKKRKRSTSVSATSREKAQGSNNKKGAPSRKSAPSASGVATHQSSSAAITAGHRFETRAVPTFGSAERTSNSNYPKPPINRRNLQWGELATPPPSLFAMGPQFPLCKKNSTTKDRKPQTPKYIHGMPVPSPPPEGMCAECRKFDPNDDPASILLCDGICGREYHLKCCLPPLETVPEGDFFCFDCSPKGTTSILEGFLDRHETEKDKYDDASSFRDYLLEQDLKEEKAVTKVPVSELWEYHQNPEQMVGKPIRIYCPPGNSYYSGRILQVRDESEDFSDTCCLVRFPAGQDYRKVPLTAWIHLEEHCVAVGTRLVWGKFSDDKPPSTSSSSPSKKQSSASLWSPAIIWSRSARELIPVVPLLSAPMGQVQFALSKERHTKTEPQRITWGLAECFGKGSGVKYELIQLETETKDFASTPTADFLKGDDDSNEELRRLMVSLALVELHEQERIQNWNESPMRNPLHKQVLQCRDEYGLGPLRYREEVPSTIQPTPLEIEGLDRSYLLEQLCSTNRIDHSKDVAASLECELVDFVPGTIRMLTSRDRKSLKNTNAS